MGQGPTWTPRQREARLHHLVERNRAQHQGEHLYENAEWMRDAYSVRRLSIRQVAAEAGCGVRTVARWLEIHGIETRSMSEASPRNAGADHPGWKPRPLCSVCGEPLPVHYTTVHLRCREWPSGPANPHWRGDEVEYGAVHGRLVAQRGRPSDYPCAQDCGKQAQEWAYDHQDPDERRNRKGRNEGPYSVNLDHYIPLCKKCHRTMDNGRGRARPRRP